jgi:hypothetical protein
MAFIPHTPADVEAMLATIGVSSIEQLFDEIPASLRVKSSGRGLTGGRYVSSAPARTSITYRPQSGLSRLGASSTAPIRRIRPKRARARCSSFTNTRR